MNKWIKLSRGQTNEVQDWIDEWDLHEHQKDNKNYYLHDITAQIIMKG